MIVRAWRGRAAPAMPDAYPEHFRYRVLPSLRAMPGFLGASLLRHDRPDEIEFLLLTRWASHEAIRAFAGEHPDRAVVEPEAVEALVSFDATVRHYDVIEEAAGHPLS